MPSPVTPNSFREVIPDLDGNFCEQFVGSWNAGALFERWYKSVFNNDGTLTEEYKALICGVGTVAPPVVPNEPPVVNPPPPTPPPPELPYMQLPQFFEATPYAGSGLPDVFSITIIWNKVPNAKFYDLLRDGVPWRRITAVTSTGPDDLHQFTVDSFPGVISNPIQHVYALRVHGDSALYNPSGWSGSRLGRTRGWLGPR